MIFQGFVKINFYILHNSEFSPAGSLKIFRDDIEEIDGIITSDIEQKNGPDSWRNKLTVEADEFILDDISELGTVKGNYLRNLTFIVGPCHLLLYLKPGWALLKVDNSDDTTLMGIATRIDAVLQKRRRILGYINSTTGYSLLSMLTLLYIAIQIFLFTHHIFYAFIPIVQAVLTKSKDKVPPATSSAVTKEANEVSQKQPEK
jgi:hypothetical protein